jgi:hypothetical protein
VPNSGLPNLFVLGAPKCGTTAVRNYLAQHPDLYVPEKERHPFGRDLTFGPRSRMTEAECAAVYGGATGQRYRADCAIWYLFSETAAQEIAEAVPDARCIALLRQPADMVYSLHSEFLYQGDEDITDFAEALAAEEDRRHGHRIPPDCYAPWALQYRQVARYADQLERYLAVFPPEQLHIVLFDDLRADTPAVYRGILEFLGLDASHEATLEVANPNKVVRSPGMRDFLRHPPEPLRRIGRTVVRSPRARALIGYRLEELNTAKVTRAPMDPASRALLLDAYADDVDRLAKLIDRDLRHWQQ